jgi:uncharacterized protein YhaN
LAANARKELAQFEKNLVAHALKEVAWIASWKVATAALAFDGQASLAAVAAAVKVWRDLPARRLLYESEMKRVRGMDRDIAEFEQEVNRLTQLIAPDFPKLPPVDQAIRLNEIVAEQARQQLLYETAESKVEQESSNLETAERNADRDSKLVQTRMSELALTSEPIATLERLERATAIRSRIIAARSILIAQSDGLPEDQLRTELDGFDSQATLTEIQLLAQGFPAQDGAINQVFADKSAQEKALSDAESGSGAEVALQQLKSGSGNGNGCPRLPHIGLERYYVESCHRGAPSNSVCSSNAISRNPFSESHWWRFHTHRPRIRSRERSTSTSRRAQHR